MRVKGGQCGGRGGESEHDDQPDHEGNLIHFKSLLCPECLRGGERQCSVVGILESTVSRALQEREGKVFDCSGWIMASTANITHGWLWL